METIKKKEKRMNFLIGTVNISVFVVPLDVKLTFCCQHQFAFTVINDNKFLLLFKSMYEPKRLPVPSEPCLCQQPSEIGR